MALLVFAERNSAAEMLIVMFLLATANSVIGLKAVHFTTAPVR
jgi:hypothetical protein